MFSYLKQIATRVSPGKGAPVRQPGAVSRLMKWSCRILSSNEAKLSISQRRIVLSFFAVVAGTYFLLLVIEGIRAPSRGGFPHRRPIQTPVIELPLDSLGPLK